MNDASQSIAKKDPVTGLSIQGKILAIVTIIIWISLFAAGVIVDSSPYRTQITSGSSSETSMSLVMAWFVVLLCFTPTNIALLSMFSGLLGALGRKATLHEVPDEDGDENEFPADPINPYLSGVIRGFFVYLAIISGTVIVLETPFSSPTQEQYIRLAGILSVVSFIISYNPRNFGSFIQRALDALKRKPKKNRVD
jgi:hypothetical protein